MVSRQGKKYRNKRSFWSWNGFHWHLQSTNELYYKINGFTPEKTGKARDPTLNYHDGRYGYTIMEGAVQHRGFGWYWPSWYWSRIEYKIWYYRHWNAFLFSWRHISPWKRSYGQWIHQNWGYRTEHLWSDGGFTWAHKNTESMKSRLWHVMKAVHWTWAPAVWCHWYACWTAQTWVYLGYRWMYRQINWYYWHRWMWWYWTLGLYPQGNWLWAGAKQEDQFDGVFYGVNAKRMWWWVNFDTQVKVMYAYGLTPYGHKHNQVLKNYHNAGVVAYLSYKNPEWDENPMDPYGIDAYRYWYGGPRVTMKIVDTKKYIPQLSLNVYGELIITPAKSYTKDVYNHYNWYGRHKRYPRWTWSPIVTLYQSRFQKTNWPYWKVFHSYLWSYDRAHSDNVYRDIVNGTWPWRWWWNSHRRRHFNFKTLTKQHYGKFVYRFNAHYRQWADWHNYSFFYFQDNLHDTMYGWGFPQVNTDQLIHHMGTTEDGFDNKYNRFNVEFRTMLGNFGPLHTNYGNCSTYKWGGANHKLQNVQACNLHPTIMSGWSPREKRVVCKKRVNNGKANEYLSGNAAGYQERFNGRKWMKYWRNIFDCINPGEIYDYRKKICRKPVPSCKALNGKRNNCGTCLPGYQLYGKSTIKDKKGKKKVVYKPRLWFYKQKRGKNQWINRMGEDWRKASVKCMPCPGSRVYNPFTKECHKSRVDPNIVYDISKLQYGIISITDLMVPKILRAAPYQDANIAALFDLSLYMVKQPKKSDIKSDVIIETLLFWSKDKLCRNLKCSEGSRRYHWLRQKEIWRRGDSKKIWANLDLTDHKDAKGEHYYRLMFQHLVPTDKFLKLQINIFTKDNNYKNFYIKRFNHRFDMKKNADNFYANKSLDENNKGGDGDSNEPASDGEIGHSYQVSTPSWDWYNKQIYAKKLVKPVDRRVANPDFGKKKGDSPGIMTFVKKGDKIPKQYKKLKINVDRRMTVAQTWIRLGSQHRKSASTVVDLMTVNLKTLIGDLDVNLSIHALPKNDELFVKLNGKRILDGKKKKAKAASVNRIDWKKWQFVGIALKYRVFRNRFLQCFHLVSSRVNGDVYRGTSGFLCNSFPRYRTAHMSATFLSKDLNAVKSSVNGFIYGGNLATDILHMHYYSEGNVFLNFEMNNLFNQYEVKNFARKYDKGNNAFFVYESDDHKFKKFVDNEVSQGIPYIMVKNRPRTAFPNFGPLQPSFYINGVVSIKDNLEKMLILNPKSFNETMPVYRFVTPTGQDLIRINNRVTFDIKKRFVPFKIKKSQEGKTFERAESSMEVFLKYYHYKTGKLGTKFVDGQFDSPKLRLEDFAKKEYLFTFSIWHRPTSRYYRLHQNRTNFMVTIQHSWGYFETYPMYSNNLFENVSNKHLLGHSLDGAYAKIYPNIFKFKSFAVTHGPLKYSSTKIEEDYYGTKLDELKLTIKEKFINVKQGDSVPDAFTKIYTGSDREKKIDAADDVYVKSYKEAGGWGGVCKCPSGKSYFVGDEWNGNKTLACVGGKQGKRWRKVHKKWAHMKAVCAQRTGSFAYVSSYFHQGHSFDCKAGFILTNKDTQVTCSAPPQWDFLVQNKYEETILADHKEKNDHDYRPKFVKYTAVDDTCLVYPTAGWLHALLTKKSTAKKGKSKKPADQKECLSCVDGTWLNPNPKKPTKLHGKDCQKCKVKNCAKCDKIGCIYCKEGFGFFKRKCMLCKKDQVYDPFTRRCFVKKVNQYIDFHTEHKNKIFAVTDIFGTKDNHTALFNFDIQWKKELENGAKVGPEPLALNVTSITTSLKWVIDEGKKVSQEIVKTESTLFSDLPLKATRTIYYRMPLLASSDIQLIIKPIMKNPKDFQFYKMVNFKYSLQRHQQPKDKRMKFPENKEANKQVKAEH